jgi:hypothetical protein
MIRRNGFDHWDSVSGYLELKLYNVSEYRVSDRSISLTSSAFPQFPDEKTYPLQVERREISSVLLVTSCELDAL